MMVLDDCRRQGLTMDWKKAKELCEKIEKAIELCRKIVEKK
jgi:hypothetical protein